MSSRLSTIKLDNKIERVLAFDPGTSNFAWSMLDKNRVIACGFIKSTISDLTDISMESQIKVFVKFIRNLIKKFNPQMVVAERFMVRGRWLGASCEKINVMLGVVGYLCVSKGIKYRLITSALWKNRVQKDRDKTYLNERYKRMKDIKIPPHVIDAAFIGAYFTCESYTNRDTRKILGSLKRVFA